MECIDGKWVMKGLDFNDPMRIKTPEELLEYIEEVGFLPLFSNEIPGFSVEDRVWQGSWWTDDSCIDPWIWREILARSGKVAYGKFFNKKTGFISLKWFPAFANYRRDGYDFDARWDDEQASYRSKKMIDLFEENEELYSFEIKKKAGFGKEGEKNFEGTLTDLQMMGYLIVRDFRKRRRKKDGAEYGWAIAVYTTPERLIGYDRISEAYHEDPAESYNRIIEKIKEAFPQAEEKTIRKIMK